MFVAKNAGFCRPLQKQIYEFENFLLKKILYKKSPTRHNGEQFTIGRSFENLL
ncbi:conserved hypothetical protein [Treponema phagedenis]|uniref:Uncharacterized protein n=1 Tax=Treponema phagedenis TaxID=162 RepID=A0A0B7H086_TREPH|nr:conserved hypothetical protein [Treponema phagedenis]